MQGAGGVGGLLAVVEHKATGNSAYYPSYDANGNISEYLDNTGSVAVHYEYSPFGRLTLVDSETGAPDFNHRFSTKYRDVETGLYYYGHRFYNPELGLWINRDPIGAQFGANLYAFCGNNPVNFVDPDGRFAREGHEYWMDVAVAGQDRGGVVGNLQTAGASIMTSFIDFWGARTLQGNAEKWGTAAGEGRTGAAIGYGTLAVGQIALEAVAAGGRDGKR